MLAVALLAGCTAHEPTPRQPIGSEMPTGTSAEKTGTGELRHDTAPLTDRFAPLAGLQSATWMSGTFGDAPGPSLYWIDAIVVLSAEDYTQLVEGLALEPAADAPPVIDELAASLPSGEFVTSSELDAQFSLDQYRTQVYANADSHSIVVLSVFE
jgi:hypothetical protein